MDNERIKNLAAEWEHEADVVLCDGIIKIKKTESLLKAAYELCTEYHQKDAVPKEMCRLFKSMYIFLDGIATVYCIDECTTPSDSAAYSAVGYIMDELEYGFYNGKYELSYPYIQVSDSNGKEHELNVEGDFLECLIDANR